MSRSSPGAGAGPCRDPGSPDVALAMHCAPSRVSVYVPLRVEPAIAPARRWARHPPCAPVPSRRTRVAGAAWPARPRRVRRRHRRAGLGRSSPSMTRSSASASVDRSSSEARPLARSPRRRQLSGRPTPGPGHRHPERRDRSALRLPVWVGAAGLAGILRAHRPVRSGPGPVRAGGQHRTTPQRQRRRPTRPSSTSSATGTRPAADGPVGSRRHGRSSTSRPGAPRLPDPRRARERQAAGLARQRGDHAEAAGGDRPARRTSTSTRTPTSTAPRTSWRRARPTPTRARARTVRAVPQRAVGRGDRVRPRRDRGASTWWRRAGAASNIGEGDEIVITHLEHHANIVPWQQLCAETGAKLRVDPGRRPRPGAARRVRRSCSDRGRKLVAVTQVSNALGTVTPVAGDRRAWRTAHGALVLVDGAQAVSHMRGRRAGARLRLLRLLRPQGVRPDRHRRACTASARCSTRCRPGRAAAT